MTPASLLHILEGIPDPGGDEDDVPHPAWGPVVVGVPVEADVRGAADVEILDAARGDPGDPSRRWVGEVRYFDGDVARVEYGPDHPRGRGWYSFGIDHPDLEPVVEVADPDEVAALRRAIVLAVFREVFGTPDREEREYVYCGGGRARPRSLGG